MIIHVRHTAVVCRAMGGRSWGFSTVLSKMVPREKIELQHRHERTVFLWLLQDIVRHTQKAGEDATDIQASANS